MKTVLALAFVLASTAGVPFLASGTAGGGAPLAASPAAPGLPAGAAYPTAVADAVRNAAIHGALEDFWIDVATCLNEGDTLAECMDDAMGDYQDAYQEIQQQHDARHDIALLLLGFDPYEPDVDPMEFSPVVDNPFFPLVPGTTKIYQKQKPKGLEQVEMTVLPGTADIGGVTCRAVREVETLNGDVAEDTTDWFAQKSDGSVWYLGEVSQNFEDGFLDNLDGSWRFGKDGALPGVIMPATPSVGAAYRQEFLLGEAEDIAIVVATGLTVTVPAGTFTGCIETKELTPLEPGKSERKFYAPGVGLVRELDPETGESLELVQVTMN